MNPFDIFKQLQDLQGKMDVIKDKLKSVKVMGTAGGDMVKIEMNGQMEVTSVYISPEIVDPNDVGMIEDLVLAAFTDANFKIREKLKDELSELTGGLNIPPGLFG